MRDISKSLSGNIFSNITMTFTTYIDSIGHVRKPAFHSLGQTSQRGSSGKGCRLLFPPVKDQASLCAGSRAQMYNPLPFPMDQTTKEVGYFLSGAMYDARPSRHRRDAFAVVDKPATSLLSTPIIIAIGFSLTTMRASILHCSLV